MADDESGRFTRRDMLRAGALGSFVGLAGCGGTTNAGDGSETQTDTATLTESPTETEIETETPTETETEPPTEIEAETETETETETEDSEAPSISALSVEPTETSGELSFTVEASDDSGLSSLEITTTTGGVGEELGGERETAVKGTVEAPPGEKSAVTVTLTDVADRTTTRTVEAYARSWDAVTDTAYDLGARYRLFQHYDADCLSAEPALGRYQEADLEMVTRHLDQLRGGGFSRVVVDANNGPKVRAAGRFAETPLGHEVSVSFRYDFVSWSRHGTSLDEQLSLLREHIASMPNYDTFRGRHVVTLANLERFLFKQDVPALSDLRERHGGPAGLADKLRSGLTIGGTEPFLVGQVGTARSSWIAPYFDRVQPIDEFLQQMDAVKNNPPKLPTVDTVEGESLDTAWVDQTRSQIRKLRLYAEQNGVEFVPQVSPASVFVDGDCQPTLQVTRDTERFESLLQHATFHATTDRVLVNSFNDWGEGTQIEPGRSLGTDYGGQFVRTARSAVSETRPPVVGSHQRYHVTPDGSDSNPGSEAEPLATIQEGVVRATPGQTVEVHAGTYHQQVRTVRDGTSEKPITLTGADDAVLKLPDDDKSFWIKNSHIRLTGMTLDGLLNPEEPDDPESYCLGNLVLTRPPGDSDEYLEDIHVAPSGIGNARRAMMMFQRTKDLEIGPLEIIGMAGAEYNVGDLQSHVGEFIYLGQPPRVVEGREHPEYNWDLYPWQGELDATRNVHIHHVDNSEGHLHSEFVDCKTGTRDVLIEYCTDAGGSNNTEPWNDTADVRFHSTDATVRWCDFRNGQGRAVHVVDHSEFVSTLENPSVTPAECGTDHSIYGNVFRDFGEPAVEFSTSAEEQRVVCGNDISGGPEGQGNPTEACPADLPQGDGVGHLGGDSPWT